MKAPRLQVLRDHVKKHGISTEHMMRLLSDDAKAVAGGCFGMMRPGGESQLRFGMKESRPTARTQAALDEIEAMGGVLRQVGLYGEVIYTPLVNFRDFFKWMMKADRESVRFKIAEPIPSSPLTSKEAK
jgi:hypothetical protein